MRVRIRVSPSPPLARRGHVITFVVDVSPLCFCSLGIARRLRIEKENGVYHIINRGNYRQDLFINESAHLAFEYCLFEACEK